MKTLRELFSAVHRPLREISIFTHYANTQFALAMAQRALDRAKDDLQLAIVARDEALALIRALEAPPRMLPPSLVKANHVKT